jgi:hypothetical protein
MDQGGNVFNRTAPVIQLSEDAAEDDYFALLGLLNSSTIGFWLKQVANCKGLGGQGGGIKPEAEYRAFSFNATNVGDVPLPLRRPARLARQVHALARAFAAELPEAVCQRGVPEVATLTQAREQAYHLRGQMIALQEELDWLYYQLYGLLGEDSGTLAVDLTGDAAGGTSDVAGAPPIALGQRAFEIVLARQIAAGEVETTWFTRHESTPITELPQYLPADYRAVVQRRIDLIESDKNIGLIEKPEYKRRWNTEPWDVQQARALKGWLLDRLESYFDFDGRMNEAKKITAAGDLREPRLTNVARTADLARADKDFLQVAEIYAGRMDFDVVALVAELITAESVPALPILRYKPAALDKRVAWERTWELQRLEDAVDAVFDVQRLKAIEPEKGQPTLTPMVSALRIDEKAKPQVLREAVAAAGYVADAVKQKLNLEDDAIQKPVQDAARRAKKAAVGDIPVPPKYASADFQTSGYWRLRGKLDVPKERWVSFPHCEGEDGTLVIAWAGYDHLQLARAIAERYEIAKENEGRKLVPLLAAIDQLIPWLKQWHNELDPAFGTRMGDYFEGYLAEEAKALGQTVDQVRGWIPPAKAKKVPSKVPTGAGGFPDDDRDLLLIAAGLSLVGLTGVPEDTHLDALILMTTPERCRATTPDTDRFDNVARGVPKSLWSDTSAKWKQVRDLLREARAIEIDPHSGHIVRKEPVFSKLRNRYGFSLDDLAQIAIGAAHAIKNSTASIQKAQSAARQREKRVG